MQNDSKGKKELAMRCCVIISLLCILSVLFNKSQGRSILRVERPAELVTDKLVKLGLPVIVELPDYCLICGTETDCNRLQQMGVATEKLVDNIGEKLLFYLLTAPGFDRHQLTQFGQIIASDDEGVFLVTSPDNILSLNRLPVKLSKIALNPLPLYEEFPSPLPYPVSENLVQQLVARVNADSVLNTIRRLQEFYTRYSTSESCFRAVEWMREKLLAYGCDSTALEPFLPGYAPNVIGVKHGRVNPRQIYIICGHIDNTSDYAPYRCPGSDDNASGTTAVLEAARVFSDIDFAYSVYFIGFSGEEQGLWGSDSFATRARRRGDSIRAVLNFDMISYGRENLDTLNVVGKSSNPNCAWLVDSFIASAQTYTNLKTYRRLVTRYPSSDHHSFWQQGYVALCGIERDFTPMYHTVGDTIGPLYYTHCGTNNWLMTTEAIKAAVATLAKFAGALPPTGAGENNLTHGRIISSVQPSVGRPPFFFTAIEQPATIFNSLGVPVQRLLPGARQWDGTDFTSRPVQPGVYIIRSKSGSARVVVTH